MRLIEQIDYDFSILEKNSRSMMQEFGFLELAMRQSIFQMESLFLTPQGNQPLR